MKYSTRLLIPAGLAIIAAAINYFAMKSATQPVGFVQVTRDLAAGKDVFDNTNLARLDLPAGFDGLRKTAVAYEHVGILYGQPVPRDFQTGDIVFRRDSPESGVQTHLRADEEVVSIPIERAECVPALLSIGSHVSFRFQKLDQKLDEQNPKWVGPFRIVAVNGRLHDDKGEPSASAAPKTISVAIPKAGSQRSKGQQLEEYCDAQSMGKVRLLRIRHELGDSGSKGQAER